MQRIDLNRGMDFAPKTEGERVVYYPNRPLAQAAADRGQQKYLDAGVWSATAQFEPDKGFVAVLFSTKNIPEANDEGFEVRTKEYGIQKTPSDWATSIGKKAPAAAKDGSKPAARPTSGVTARVHAIADELKEAGKVSSRADRSVVIDACIEAGINKATAATQWSKYAKAQGW